MSLLGSLEKGVGGGERESHYQYISSPGSFAYMAEGCNVGRCLGLIFLFLGEGLGQGNAGIT